jgi:hypothetical protein
MKSINKLLNKYVYMQMDPKNIMAELMIQEQKILIKQNELKQKQEMNTLQKAKSYQITSDNNINITNRQHAYTLLKPSTTFCVGIQKQVQQTYKTDNYFTIHIAATTSHLFWRPAPTSKLYITESHTLPGSLTVFNNKGKLTTNQNRYVEYKPLCSLTIRQNRYMEYKPMINKKVCELRTKIKNNTKIINALKYEIKKNNLHDLNKKVAEKIKDLNEMTGKQKGFANKFALINNKYNKLRREYENQDQQLKKQLDIIDKSKNKAGTLVQFLLNKINILIGQFAKYRQNVRQATQEERQRKQQSEKEKKKGLKAVIKREYDDTLYELKLTDYNELIKKCDSNLEKLENRWDLNQQEYDNMKKTIEDRKKIIKNKKDKLKETRNYQLQKQLEDALYNKLH